MQTKKSAKSAIFSWAISYLIILIIPVSVFLYSTMITSRLVRNEVSRSNALILDNLEVLDDQMLSLYNAFQYAFANKYLVKLAATNQKDSSFYSSAESLQRSLADYYLTNDNISILIYFHKWEYLVCHTTSNELIPLYHMQKMSGLTIDKDTWIEQLKSVYKNYFFTENLSMGSSEKHLVYGHTVRMSGYPVTIFTMIPYSRLANSTKRLQGSTLFISDEEGVILASFGSISAFKTLSNALSHEEPVIGEDGRRYVLTLYESPTVNNWYYALATPEEDYWEVFNYINTLFIGSIAISMLISIPIASLLLKRNYQPLKSITQMLREAGASKNEYDLIASSYKQLINENTNMRGQLNEQSIQLKERYILSRLKGRKPTLSTADTNTYFQIENEGRTYCLVALSIEGSTRRGSDVPIEEQEFELLLYALDNVTTEVLDKYNFYKIEDGRNLLYLLYLSDDELAKWNSENLEIMSFVQDFFQQHLSINVAIAISDFTDDFEQVSQLYTNTVRALEYKTITGYKDVIMVEDFNKLIEDTGIYQDTEWIKELKTALSHGDYAQILKIVDHLFKRRLSEDSMPLLIFRIELNDCMYSVLDTYSSVVTDNKMRHRLVNKIIDLMTSNNIEDMKKKFLDALYYACDTIFINNKDTTDNLILQVRQFINENYADHNLNISFIAEQFSKNANYLSQLYYSQTGQGMLDTIHEVRIQHAKELLQNPSITIEQAAQAVGFSNARTFKRVLVKQCGASPRQYQVKTSHLHLMKKLDTVQPID